MKKHLILVSSVFFLSCSPLLANGEESSSQLTNNENKVAQVSDEKTAKADQNSTSTSSTDNKQGESSTKKTNDATETTVEKEIKTDTVKEEQNKQNVAKRSLPKEVQGEWVTTLKNGEKRELIITNNKYIFDGTEYSILDYNVENNEYMLSWDDEAYIKKYGKQDFWNPQPLSFSYNSNKDSIQIGDDNYTRKETTNPNEDYYDEYAIDQDFPVFLQDRWVTSFEGKTLSITIGPRSFILNDTEEYKINSYAKKGNTYVLDWDVDEFISKYGEDSVFNPQPIMFDYNQTDDTIISGAYSLVYRREAKTTTSTTNTSSTNNNVSNNSSANSPNSLPKTGENFSFTLLFIGSMMTILGSSILIKKFK